MACPEKLTHLILQIREMLWVHYIGVWKKERKSSWLCEKQNLTLLLLLRWYHSICFGCRIHLNVLFNIAAANSSLETKCMQHLLTALISAYNLCYQETLTTSQNHHCMYNLSRLIFSVIKVTIKLTEMRKGTVADWSSGLVIGPGISAENSTTWSRSIDTNFINCPTKCSVWRLIRSSHLLYIKLAIY